MPNLDNAVSSEVGRWVVDALLDVCLHSPLALLVVHEVTRYEKTRLLLHIDGLLRALSVVLLVWQVHDSHVGALARHEDCY